MDFELQVGNTNTKSDSSYGGLTDDQTEGHGLMSQMYDMFTLKGYAGTGKTYLLQNFIRSIKTKDVVVTAPTHKAVGVANGNCTIHSYLSLKIKHKEDKQVLTQAYFTDNIREGVIVIIDESSMVSRELLGYILDAQEKYNLKLIFIGDPAQIPPVGERISPVWELDNPSFTLTDIVRQARGSNIISLATALREGSVDQGGVTEFVDNKQVFTGGINELKKFYLECMEDEGNFPQIISYRNKIVDSSNIWARNIVKNNPTDAFLPGEEVYIRSVGEDQVHKLEDIVRIEEITKPFKYDERKVDYSFNVIRLYVTSHKGEEWLMIPSTPKDVEIIQKNKNAMAKRAKNKQEPWGNFWKFTYSISEVKHIYSMTCHRSQGSTFKNVVVNCNDISSDRLFYTATTRASEKLFLFIQ